MVLAYCFVNEIILVHDNIMEPTTQQHDAMPTKHTIAFFVDSTNAIIGKKYNIRPSQVVSDNIILNHVLAIGGIDPSYYDNTNNTHVDIRELLPCIVSRWTVGRSVGITRERRHPQKIIG